MSAGHILPTIRAGSEMRSERNDLMFKSLPDNACRTTAESGTFCDKYVSVIFLRSFGYILLIGKSLTLTCLLHRSSAMTYYTVMSKASSPLPLKLFASHILYLNRSSSTLKIMSYYLNYVLKVFSSSIAKGILSFKHRLGRLQVEWQL